MPSTVPTITENAVASVATSSEVVVPATIRENTSRPVPGSTPNQCEALMPPRVPKGSE